MGPLAVEEAPSAGNSTTVEERQGRATREAA